MKDSGEGGGGEEERRRGWRRRGEDGGGEERMVEGRGKEGLRKQEGRSGEAHASTRISLSSRHVFSIVNVITAFWEMREDEDEEGEGGRREIRRSMGSTFTSLDTL
eukprot:747949-Hanusia_phi.AAC.4